MEKIHLTLLKIKTWFIRKLLNKNYCDEIRDKISAQTLEDGTNPQTRLAVIGFDYDVDKNKNLENCVGKSNVFSAKNMNEVYNRLIELIKEEEIGRLYTY